MLKTEKLAVVVLSGGQDSTTCLFIAKDRGYNVHAVTIDYGQRHRAEIDAARIIARRAAASHEVIELGSCALKGTSPLVSDAPLEQYANHQSLPGGLEKTFVPMRNQLFLTLAANRAYVLGSSLLFTGVCEEDFGGYPDCRREFIDALALASNRGTFTGEEDTLPPLSIATPLMRLTKAETVRIAAKNPACYQALAFSHTSYDGVYPPTGSDHATLLRAKGFEEAGVPDPLILRAWSEGRMTLPSKRNYQQLFPYMEWVEDAIAEEASYQLREKEAADMRYRVATLMDEKMAEARAVPGVDFEPRTIQQRMEHRAHLEIAKQSVAVRPAGKEFTVHGRITLEEEA